MMDPSHSHTLAMNSTISYKKRDEVELTDDPQCNAQPNSPTTDPFTEDAAITNHPAAFSFPTLDPDGSLLDLTAVPTHRYPPTPPAALSSLGAKARMSGDMSDSINSLTDSQYDMADDVSEISNDDHETASLTSTEHGGSDDGQLTPDETGSIVDIQEERERDIEVHHSKDDTTGHGSLETLLDQRFGLVDDRTKAENQVMDSYMSEDLETPRQSTLPNDITGPSTRGRTSNNSTPTSSTPPQDNTDVALRILFVSEREVIDDKMAGVCHRLASCIADDSQNYNGLEPKITRLPPTPSGISPSSAFLLRTGNVELTIQHCVGAHIRSFSPESYNLRIQDADREHTSIFTVGKDRKIDLETPELVVFYVHQPRSFPSWFKTVKMAMLDAKVPNITIGGPSVDFGRLSSAQKEKAYDSDIVLADEDFYDDFYNDGHLNLCTDLGTILGRKFSPQSKPQSPRSRTTSNNKAQAKQMVWQYMKKQILPLLIMGLLLINYQVYYWQPSPDPAVELAVRRDALSTALVKMTNSTEAAKAFNISHLLPQPTDVSSNAQSQDGSPERIAHFQGVSPNHIVISLHKERGSKVFPRAILTSVYKSYSRKIPSNFTELIDGVYDVSIAPQDGFGLVTVELLVSCPWMNVELSHDFGRRMLQRRTYEQVSTDLSKRVNKPVAAARQNARSLKEKVGLELSATAAATKNVTTQLALYMARDLQVLGNTALSVADKAAKASQHGAVVLKKDFQHSFDELAKDVQKLTKSTVQSAKALIPSKKTVAAPLALSRERALGFKDLLAGRKKDANSTSATKELSLRLQNIFKPSQKTKKAGSLSDIARCVRAQDYKACRREQKLKAILPHPKTPNRWRRCGPRIYLSG